MSDGHRIPGWYEDPDRGSNMFWWDGSSWFGVPGFTTGEEASEGWYADPWDQGDQRYFDGQEWTGHLSDRLPRDSDTGISVNEVLVTVCAGGAITALVYAAVLLLVALTRPTPDPGGHFGDGLLTGFAEELAAVLVAAALVLGGLAWVLRRQARR